MSHLRRVPACVLLAAGIVCAGPAGALTELSVFTSATARSADDLDSESDVDSDDVADALSAASNASVSPNAASTQAQVGYGWARASASGNASGEDSRGGGGAQARFQDDLVISAPGLDGLPGFLRFQVSVGGTISASASGDATASASWNVAYQIQPLPTTTLVEGAVHDGSGGPIETGDQGGGTFVSPPIGFSFGVPFSLSMALNVEADAREGASAAALFPGALEWQGLEVRTGGGELVLEFVVDSGSGADWAGPIPAPEPTPGSLALASVGGLVALARARRGSWRHRRSAMTARAVHAASAAAAPVGSGTTNPTDAWPTTTSKSSRKETSRLPTSKPAREPGRASPAGTSSPKNVSRKIWTVPALALQT